MKKIQIFIFTVSMIITQVGRAQTQMAVGTVPTDCTFIGKAAGIKQTKGKWILVIGDNLYGPYPDSAVIIDRNFSFFKTPEGKDLLNKLDDCQASPCCRIQELHFTVRAYIPYLTNYFNKQINEQNKNRVDPATRNDRGNLEPHDRLQ